MRKGFVVGAIVSAMAVMSALPRIVVADDNSAADRSAAPESISGTPAEGEPSDQAPLEPFAPPDVGPPESVWRYENLKPEERAVVDRNRDIGDGGSTQSAYASAVRERSQSARAQAAQHLLGLDSWLESAGVVP